MQTNANPIANAVNGTLSDIENARNLIDMASCYLYYCNTGAQPSEAVVEKMNCTFSLLRKEFLRMQKRLADISAHNEEKPAAPAPRREQNKTVKGGCGR